MFRNFLDGKTCILVTHQLQYVKAAKLICLLESGTLQAMGSYDEITESGSHFLQFLSKDKIKITEANVKFDKTFETLDTPHDKKENNDETRDTKHDDKQPLIIREVCQKGSVTMGTYIGYFKSANSNILLAILFCLVIIASSVDLLGRLVLGKW
jgi:ATP-binding cassette subfamily C (CFTR/MRP) protein 4